ncbi:MAG TPA: DUF2934 domain-containing protein [Acetobacteraceae bacterium]|nr:DUF2934 domain-containing protein [Acetobacteraceae bacterium]
MAEIPPNPFEASTEEDEKIRKRAYYLWLEDGCPHGRDAEYWERARELQAIADNPDAGQLPNPARVHPNPADDEVVDEAELEENLGEFPSRFTDQGDRHEAPMTRRVAESTPVIGEHDAEETAPDAPQSASASTSATAPRAGAKAPAAKAATPLGKPKTSAGKSAPAAATSATKPARSTTRRSPTKS